MERRKNIAHTEISRSERLLQYKEKIGQAIVNIVLGRPENEAEDMTLLERGSEKTISGSGQDNARDTERNKKRFWKSGDKITDSTEFDLDREYTMEEYQKIRAAFKKQPRDVFFPDFGGVLRW